MHIGFLTPEYPHRRATASAGIGTSIKNLADALIKKGTKVSIFLYGQSKDENFIENGIHFHFMKQRKYKFMGGYLHRKFLQDYLNKFIERDKIDILEAPDWTGITAFMKFPIPLIIRIHGSDTYFCYLEGRKQKWKNKFFETNAIHSAKAFIAPTTFAGKVSKKLFNIKGKEIRTIHYGLELQKFHNESPDTFEDGLILYIGTLIRKKGVLELPEIFKLVMEKYRGAKLILIGADAPDIKTGKASTWSLFNDTLAETLKISVEYSGKIPYHQVQEMIKKAHVCVFPSYAETLGMVTIESMALKKPVVNSSIGWAKELIDHEINGFLTHPADHKQFADNILKLLQNDTLRKTISANASLKVKEKFDIHNLVEANLQFYQEIISQD